MKTQEIVTTFALVGTALALSLLVALTGPSEEVFGIEDQGTPFFEEFDPAEIRTLEVISYDEETATLTPFQLTLKPDPERDTDVWVIPSEFDYPAEAEDRLRRTAGGILSLKKTAIRSDNLSDHEALGVLDPTDEQAALTGRGTLVRLLDDAGSALAEFIIGKPVPKQSGQRFVRVPGRSRTYAVQLDIDLSTKLTDWIEPRPFGISSFEIRSLTLNGDRLTIDRIARRATISSDGQVTLSRPDSDASNWQIVSGEGPPAGQELDTSAISGVASDLANLSIVGVRPKSIELADLQFDSAALNQMQVQNPERYSELATTLTSIQNQGFTPLNNGLIVSELPRINLGTEDGIEYTLIFGDQTQVETGREIGNLDAESDPDATTGEGEEPAEDESGEPQDAPELSLPDLSELPIPDEEESNTDTDEVEVADAQYLLITATFNPALLPPEEPVNRDPATVEEVFQDPFAQDEEAIAERERAYQEKVAEAQQARQELIDEGEQAAQSLRDRFAPWIYLVEAETVQNLLIDREQLFREEGAEETPTNPPGSPTPLPFDPSSLPPGFGPTGN